MRKPHGFPSRRTSPTTPTRRASPSSGARCSRADATSACSSGTSAPSGASISRSCRTSSRASSTRRTTAPSCSSAAVARRCATSSSPSDRSSRRASSPPAGSRPPTSRCTSRRATCSFSRSRMARARGVARSWPASPSAARRSPTAAGARKSSGRPSARSTSPTRTRPTRWRARSRSSSPTRRSANGCPRTRVACTPSASRWRTPSPRSAPSPRPCPREGDVAALVLPRTHLAARSARDRRLVRAHAVRGVLQRLLRGASLRRRRTDRDRAALGVPPEAPARRHPAGPPDGSRRVLAAYAAAARAAGWQFAGVDVNAQTNAFTRALGFQVDDGSIESLDPARRVDVVAIWNCLDQLADPASAVRAARAHLASGGMLAVRVPNGACYAAFRPLLQSPLAGIAREWLAQNNLLGFPYRYGFTPTALERLLVRNGMRVEQVVGDVLVPIADRWTKRWAALEERLVKRVIAAGARIARGDKPLAPWFELYARVE